jgi:hypothetical protein
MSRETQLWGSVLTGPTAWFLSLLANFALAGWSCTRFGKAPLLVVTAIALALSAASGFLAWHVWRQVGVEQPGESGGTVAHERSMALAGVLMSGMFIVVIVAQSVPDLMLGGCE